MLETGTTIAGRYLLESPIGEGAMGEVWRALDQTLKRQVAIKVLFLQTARDPNIVLEQFLREARIAAAVQHRNVIQTVDFGTEGDLPFMVMELLNGESLEERMEREPALTVPELLQITSLTLRGLAAVHDAGIVHRDLKPANIFLQKEHDGVFPKILDFGISRSLEGPSAIKTVDGLIVGTPDYMSPEQARGEADIDRRSDIYSMGAILYQGISGRLPFAAETIGQLIVDIVTKRPPSLKELCPKLPPILADVVAQAMAHDREERFIDARVMRTALTGASQRALPSLGRPTVSEAPPREAMAVAPPQQGGSGWGDFEGLGGNSAVPPLVDDAPPALSLPGPPAPPAHAAPAPVVPATFSAEDPFAGKGPAPGGEAPGGDLLDQRLALDVAASPRLSGGGGAQGRPSIDRVSFGGNSLPGDPLGEISSGPGLDLDYERGTEHNRKSAAKARAKRRQPQRAARPVRRESPVPFVVGAIVAVALLMAPRWILGDRTPVGPTVDTNAVSAHPGSTRQAQRRQAPGKQAAPLRDVGFE